MSVLTGLMNIMISLLLMTQQKHSIYFGLTTHPMGLPCFIHTLQTIRHPPASFWLPLKQAVDFWCMNSYKKATLFMPSIQRQSTVTRIGTCFQRQNLMPSMPCRSPISCAQTATCFNRSNPFPKITDFSTDFVATSVKRLMKNQELPTRLSPA